MTTPRRTQRIGAYAVIVRSGEILLTRISARGFPADHWALPGGAVDHGESPAAALRREVYEETGLHVVHSQLLDVHDVHVVDVGRGDVWEDYHGIHLLYRVGVDDSATPVVTEVDGTTAEVRWVPWGDVARLPLIPVVAHVLAHRRDYRLTSSSAG